MTKASRLERDLLIMSASDQIVVVCDIDGTLVFEDSDAQPGLAEFAAHIAEHRAKFLFAVATGRTRQLTLDVFETHRLPAPDVMIASVGTEIFYKGDFLQPAPDWSARINRGWEPGTLARLHENAPGLCPQEPEKQGPFKVSFYIDPDDYEEELVFAALRRMNVRAKVVQSYGRFLDLLPERASKGAAVRFLCEKAAVPLDRAIVCGDSGNDRDMLLCGARGVVVGNHAPELDALRNTAQIFFSERFGAAGVLDGLRHHLGDFTIDQPAGS